MLYAAGDLVKVRGLDAPYRVLEPLNFGWYRVQKSGQREVVAHESVMVPSAEQLDLFEDGVESAPAVLTSGARQS